MKKVSILLFRHGHALEYQHDRAPGGAHIDRLIGRVQHQHRRVQRLRIALLMKAKHRGAH